MDETRDPFELGGFVEEDELSETVAKAMRQYNLSLYPYAKSDDTELREAAKIVPKTVRNNTLVATALRTSERK